MATPESNAGVAGYTRTGKALSGRQRHVVAMMASGHSMKEVGRRLGITPRTVAFHKYDAMKTQGWRSNAELLAFALSEGLLERRRPGSPAAANPDRRWWPRS